MTPRWLSIDRRVIYFMMVFALAVPIIMQASVPPAQMKSADDLYEMIEDIELNAGDVAVVALDFGPNTKAENEPQLEVVLEHLFRRRVPVLIFSLLPLSEGFLKEIPERIASKLMEEFPGEKWVYGQDWINVGYRPGGGIFIQSFAKAENIPQFLLKDTYGTRLEEFPVLAETKGLENVRFLAEFTGSVGLFDYYVQFFQKEGYAPAFGHGCTSITIPEAYIYLDSNQLGGLLEGIAGAAWYSHRLSQSNEKREKDNAPIINTALGVAHLVIILLIILGNLGDVIKRRAQHA